MKYVIPATSTQDKNNLFFEKYFISDNADHIGMYHKDLYETSFNDVIKSKFNLKSDIIDIKENDATPTLIKFRVTVNNYTLTC